jgi:hypothetical protein
MAAPTGWKFSVSIPSWTTAQLGDGDEAVVVRRREGMHSTRG